MVKWFHHPADACEARRAVVIGGRRVEGEVLPIFSEVPVVVWVAGAVIVALVTWMVIWTTNKGYEKKWDEE